MEESYTIEEVAERFLRIPVKSVHNLCRDRKLRYFRANGRHKCFTWAMIQEYIEEQTVSPPKPVDRSARKSVRCPRKVRKSTEVDRAQNKEEMRSW
jgi:hypothetical protein